MTPSELQHLRALCERATPGPWRAIHGRGSGTVQAKDCAIYINVRRSEDEYLDETVARWQRDAAFIAAARSAVPALIEEVERLREEVAELQGPHCDQCGNPIDPDWCHCGSAVTSHGMADGHAPVPMGCVCGYVDEDYRRLVKSRGEHLHRLLSDLTRLTSALAEAERERDEARKHLDERIRWQLEAVLNLQTFRALFDAACLEREEAGCYESNTEPPCGECVGCKFIAAVDQAKIEVATGVDEFIQESAGFWGRFAAKMQKERDAYRAGLADLLAATKDAEPTTSLTYYRSKARDLLKNGPGKETDR